MSRWSDDAWKSVESVYGKTLELPFVKSLADGTLPMEKFMFYLRQDSLYLQTYFKVLSHIASRLGNGDYASAFIKFAADGVAVEQALHESFLKGCRPSPGEMSPACTLYTSVLKSQSYEAVEVEAAAVLPCFWVYQRVGEEIYRNGCNPDNPYKAWIETYADEAFAASTKLAIEICDDLADKASPEVREKMTEIFTMCARLEWMFWDSAWNLEKWKI